MKTILVTDPCYLLKDKDWDLCLAKADKQKGALWGEAFDKAVRDLLCKISGDKKAVAGPTGYGDWVNTINGRPFAADSGMVCVVEATEALEEYMGSSMVNPLCVAKLRVHDDTMYEIDQSDPEWSVVRIKTPKNTYESEGKYDLE